MRLTADLINSSLSYLNPLKERELDLRGHKIPALENLGAAKDHEAIDLTDNDISNLANFPLNPRLKALYLARNKIHSIAPTLAKSTPALSTLVLTQNAFNGLADLNTLAQFPRLTHLSLVENPVTSKENYRYWVIWRCPSVRFLDFQRVKDAERMRATELFGASDEPNDLAKGILSAKTSSQGVTTNNAPSTLKRTKLTEAENQRMKNLIHNATSLAEIARLEKDLAEGRIPPGVLDVEAQ